MSVLLCLSSALEEAVMEQLAAHRSELLVARRCADLVEVLGAAGAGIGTLAVIAGDEPQLSLTTVAKLQEFGLDVAVVAGAKPVDELRSLSLRVLSPEPSEIVALIERQANESHIRNAPSVPEHASTGRLVSVWGPSGSHGRSVIARELGVLSGGVLVDADTIAPSLAQMLSLEEASGIIALARAVEQGKNIDSALSAAIQVHADGCRVITGLNSGQRWKELSKPVLDRLWSELRSRYEWIIVDLSGGISPADPRGRSDRHVATRSALEASDVVLHCASATPVGLRRFLEHCDQNIADLKAYSIGVMTGVRSSSVGHGPKNHIQSVVRPSFPLEFLGDDRGKLDAALLSGRSLGHSAPKSPLVRDLRGLWETINTLELVG